MSNNIITQTYGKNLRIRPLMGGGGGVANPDGGGGGCDDCHWACILHYTFLRYF
jgi:hypothetical protein